VGGAKKAIQSLRLRLYSGLRQSGSAFGLASFGTPEGVPFRFVGLYSLGIGSVVKEDVADAGSVFPDLFSPNVRNLVMRHTCYV
jgi:hypothetical protein